MATRDGVYSVSNGYSSTPMSSSSSSPMDELQRIQEQKRAVKNRMIESTKNSLGMVIESEEIGSATATQLYSQGQQLEKINDDLDAIDANLNVTQRHLKSMSSFFSRVKNRFNKKGREVEVTESHVTERTVPDYKSMPVGSTHKVQQRQNYPKSRDHDALDDEVDENLDMIDNGLARLKFLAQDMTTEIDRQNPLIDRAMGRMGHTEDKMKGQTEKMRNLLK